MLSVESRTKSHLLSKKKEEATLHTASLGTKSEAAAGGLSRHRELWNNVERQAVRHARNYLTLHASRNLK